jgi:hypothetical protein
MVSLERSFGRRAFGLDPANYHAARPPYPELVWHALRERAGLRAGIDILEIGAGTGLATGPLLAHGAAGLARCALGRVLVPFTGEGGAEGDGRREPPTNSTVAPAQAGAHPEISPPSSTVAAPQAGSRPSPG